MLSYTAIESLKRDDFETFCLYVADEHYCRILTTEFLIHVSTLKRLSEFTRSFKRGGIHKFLYIII